MSKNHLFFKQLRCHSLIGVYPEERKKKQPLLINLKIFGNFSEAIKSDQMNHALDYEAIYNDIQSFTNNSQFKLIETLSEQLCYFLCRRYTQIEKIKIECCKPNIFEHCPEVGIYYEHDNC